jgi:subtilisin family serine protease
MKLTTILLSFPFCLYSYSTNGYLAPLIGFDDISSRPSHYVVVFHETSTFDNAKTITNDITAGLTEYTLRYYYTFGFAAYLCDDDLVTVQKDVRVKYIEADREFTANREQVFVNQDVFMQDDKDDDGEIVIMGTQKNTPSWGIARVSQRRYDTPNTYSFPDTAGQGVNIYVVDSGVYVEHSDFGGRATWGIAFNNLTLADENGHGTHVATTAIGRKYGVAKKANVIAVRVLNAAGSGYTSDVIAGLEWSTDDASNTGRKSIINLSLGGGQSDALNKAVVEAINRGVHVAAAAGNNADNACLYSPGKIFNLKQVQLMRL